MLASTNQLKELNQQPLNQEAKRWLRLAKAEASEDQPYLLQLMWWGLEEAKLNLALKDLQALRVQLKPVVYDLLNNPDKEEAFQYLLTGSGSPKERPQLSLHTLQSSMTPEEAARRALGSLSALVGSDPSRDSNYLQEP